MRFEWTSPRPTGQCAILFPALMPLLGAKIAESHFERTFSAQRNARGLASRRRNRRGFFCFFWCLRRCSGRPLSHCTPPRRRRRSRRCRCRRRRYLWRSPVPRRFVVALVRQLDAARSTGSTERSRRTAALGQVGRRLGDALRGALGWETHTYEKLQKDTAVTSR